MTDIAEFTPPGWLDTDGITALEADAPWRIHSDREASWAFRKIKGHLAEVDRIKGNFAEELERITAWRDQAVGTIEADIGFFDGALIGYRHHLEELAAERGEELPKTYKVPDGQLTRRVQQPALEYTDEQALIAWAIKNERHDLLRIEPARSMLKELLEPAPHEDGDSGWQLATSDGEMVPGVEYRAQEDKRGAKPT